MTQVSPFLYVILEVELDQTILSSPESPRGLFRNSCFCLHCRTVRLVGTECEHLEFSGTPQGIWRVFHAGVSFGCALKRGHICAELQDLPAKAMVLSLPDAVTP